MAELEAKARELQAIQLGSIGHTLDRYTVQAQKMQAKQVKALENKLSNAYSTAYSLGASYPLKEDVITGLETGNYVGTMHNPSYAPKAPQGANTGPDLPNQILPVAPGGDTNLPPRAPISGGGPGDLIFPPQNPPGGVRPPPEPPAPPVPPTQPPPVPPPSQPPTPPPITSCPPYDVNHGMSWWANMPDTFPGDGTWPNDPAGYTRAWRVGCPDGYVGQLWRWNCIFSDDPFKDPHYFLLPPGFYPHMVDSIVVYGKPQQPGEPYFCFAGIVYCVAPPPPGTPPGTQPPPDVQPPPDEQPPPGPTCAPPPPATCPTPNPFNPPTLTQDKENHCKAIEEMLNNFKLGDTKLADLVKFIPGTGTGSWVADAILKAITGRKEPILSQMINSFAKWFDELTKTTSKAVSCNQAKLAPVSIAQSIFRFVDQWFAVIPPQATELLAQMSNTACQTLMPTGSEANAAFLNDQITEEVWKCWQRIQGNLIKEQKQLVNAARTRPNAQELAVLFRRKQLEQQDYDEATRGVGVLNDQDKKRIFDTTQAWPGLQDVIRMMVRDVFDPATVADGQLDTDFADKFQGKALDYAKALGFDDELAKFYWRAHWQIPSFTMLAEMVKRLRPGVVDDKLVFTQEDLKKWLKVDDWAPGLIDRMVATTFAVVTRVDSRRMYSLHTIDEDQLQGYLMDEGYNERDAKELVKFFKRMREVSEFKSAGNPTVHAAFGMFNQGIMTEQESRNYIANVALSPDHEFLLQQSLFTGRELYNRTQAIKARKAIYMRGLEDDGTAMANLVDDGIDGTQAEELVRQWEKERRGKSKVASAAQLCKWRGMGLINQTDQAKALARLNYAEEDIALIIGQCEIEWNEKQKKAAERAAAKAVAEIEKIRRAQEKAKKAAEQAAKDAAPCKPPPKPVCGQGPKGKPQSPPKKESTNPPPSTSPSDVDQSPSTLPV